MSWIPSAGYTTNLSNTIGPIQNGLSCTVTTVSSNQVANNTTDIDEYYIVVTKNNLVVAKSKDLKVKVKDNDLVFKGYRNKNDRLQIV